MGRFQVRRYVQSDRAGARRERRDGQGAGEGTVRQRRLPRRPPRRQAARRRRGLEQQPQSAAEGRRI